MGKVRPTLSRILWDSVLWYSLLYYADEGRDATQSGGDDKPEGALGFGAADYVPQAQKLITQFNGVETDSGSCLAFAPSSRRGSGNTVTPRDWQTPSQSDVPEFIKLEPWAVPCTNEWMKDNRATPTNHTKPFLYLPTLDPNPDDGQPATSPTSA